MEMKIRFSLGLLLLFLLSCNSNKEKTDFEVIILKIDDSKYECKGEIIINFNNNSIYLLPNDIEFELPPKPNEEKKYKKHIIPEAYSISNNNRNIIVELLKRISSKKKKEKYLTDGIGIKLFLLDKNKIVELNYINNFDANDKKLIRYIVNYIYPKSKNEWFLERLIY